MCITNWDGFDMDCALEAPKETYVKTNSTFDNIKGIDMFKMNEKTIKQMKEVTKSKDNE
jgi:hypothetical protein